MERLKEIKEVVENNKRFNRGEMILIKINDVEFLINQIESSKKLSDTEFNLTTGQMIDALREGDIAKNDIFGTYVTRKSYGFIWVNKDGSRMENQYFVISDMTIDAKWKII